MLQSLDKVELEEEGRVNLTRHYITALLCTKFGATCVLSFYCVV